LKLTENPFSDLHNQLSEQHPREQGLKPINTHAELYQSRPFRATSKRTRIETVLMHQRKSITVAIFQSNIQENKD